MLCLDTVIGYSKTNLGQSTTILDLYCSWTQFVGVSKQILDTYKCKIQIRVYVRMRIFGSWIKFLDTVAHK